MGDHSSRPSVAGRLKRPTRRRGAPKRAFGRAALCPPPYLVLHREEFAWPRLSPRAPVRSYFKPVRAAPFHPSPAVVCRSRRPAGWSVLCCTCRRPPAKRLLSQPLTGGLPAVSGLAALRCSDFPLPLAPKGTRGSDRPTCSQIHGARIIAKHRSTGTVQRRLSLKL